MNVDSIVAVIGLIALAPSAALLGAEASISGTVYGPNDEIVTDAPLQTTNVATDQYQRVRSDTNGHYQMNGLTAGTYKLTINLPCCTYSSHESENIEIAAGESRVLDVRLKQGSSLGTIGDDLAIVAATILDRQKIPELPVPRMSDDRPDFSGVWVFGADPYPQKPDAHAWAKEIFDERVANYGRNHPHTQCLPGDAPTPVGGGTPFIIKIVQKPELMVILLEDLPGFRQIYVDGRMHPEDPNPTWVGHSIGRWEGDVFVVDTVGYNDRGWTNSHPRTEELHIVERFSRTEYGRLMVEVTIEDPTVFKKPWVLNTPMYLAPQEDLFEYVCENNKWSQKGGDK